MKFRHLFGVIATVAIVSMSCARMEKLPPRYSAKQCPICVVKAGDCSYCEGKGKCSYCTGSGTRKTVVSTLPQEGDFVPTTYTEKCSFCKSSGVCSHCSGAKKCSFCKGTGTVDSTWTLFKQNDAQKQIPQQDSSAQGIKK